MSVLKAHKSLYCLLLNMPTLNKAYCIVYCIVFYCIVLYCKGYQNHVKPEACLRLYMILISRGGMAVYPMAAYERVL